MPLPHACVLHHLCLEQALCKNQQQISTAFVVHISKIKFFQASLLTHTHTQSCCFWRMLVPLCLRNLLLCCWQWGWQVPHTVCTALHSRAGQWCLFQTDEIQRELKCMGLSRCFVQRHKRRKTENRAKLPVFNLLPLENWETLVVEKKA